MSKKNRPSPSESATLYKVGTKKTGNDGNTWIIVENKNGVKRWKLYRKKDYKTSKKSSKKSSKIQETDEMKNTKLTAILSAKLWHGNKIFLKPIHLTKSSRKRISQQF